MSKQLTLSSILAIAAMSSLAVATFGHAGSDQTRHGVATPLTASASTPR